MRRRTLLGLTAGVAAAGAVWQPRAHAAGPDDRARVLRNVVESMTGTAESNAHTEARDRVDAIVRTARKRIADLDGNAKDAVFAGVTLGSNEANLTTTFQYLTEIALATRLPGAPSDLAGNQELQLRLVDLYAQVHQRWYGDQDSGYYGNWYHWEIGMPTQIGRGFALLDEALMSYRPGLLGLYVASMDAYLRNGEDGDVDLGSRFHTGANLADITTNRIIQGALLDDDDRITKAVEDQLTVYATIDPDRLVNDVTDGFYADGSFLQHASVPYTGSYGTTLLARSVQMTRFLAGTGWARSADLVPVVHRWVTNSFAPVIFEGWMMEIVKGRGVSRTTSGYTDVAGVLESATELSGFAEGDIALELAGWVKHVVARSPHPVTAASFDSPLTIVRFAQILNDPTIPATDVVGDSRTYAFNSMERNVHVRPGWTFALARSSSRISKYEYMNGENLRPWFTGDGMHYLYLGGQDQGDVYGIDHLACVSPYQLAGVTSPVQDRQTIPEAYDGELWYENPDAGFTSSSEKQNSYTYFPLGTNSHSGSAALDRFATASMQLGDDVTWHDKRAGELPSDIVAYPNGRATRSWFLFDDEVVMLAAGITDTDDLAHARPLRSTLDTRLSEPDDEVSVRVRTKDGKDSGPGTHEDPDWVLWSNGSRSASVGYHFLTPVIATVALESRTGSRRDVRLSNPDTEVTKDVFGLGLVHRAGGVENYAVAIVPLATGELLRSSAQNLSLLANSPSVQAVRHRGLGVTMINTFDQDEARIDRIRVRGAASLVLSDQHDEPVTRLALSDPTTEQELVEVVLRGSWEQLDSNERVAGSRVPGGLRLVFDTRSLHGASIEVPLRRR